MEDRIFFSQSKYIKEMLKKFGLEDSKPTKTLMSMEIKLTKDDEADFEWDIQQKDRKPSQNDKNEHGMEKTVQNQAKSKNAKSQSQIEKNPQSNRRRN
ncbi:hypothetical protein Tco_0589372 [Tanacetum coccineum]